ncbi:MAG: hypothetical protein ABIM44_09400 [candidate division WOR-3 bacterium]
MNEDIIAGRAAYRNRSGGNVSAVTMIDEASQQQITQLFLSLISKIKAGMLINIPIIIGSRVIGGSTIWILEKTKEIRDVAEKSGYTSIKEIFLRKANNISHHARADTKKIIVERKSVKEMSKPNIAIIAAFLSGFISFS